MSAASERYENAHRVLKEHGYAQATEEDPGSIAQLTLALRSLLEEIEKRALVAERAEWIASAFSEAHIFIEQEGREALILQDQGYGRSYVISVTEDGESMSAYTEEWGTGWDA